MKIAFDFIHTAIDSIMLVEDGDAGLFIYTLPLQIFHRCFAPVALSAESD